MNTHTDILVVYREFTEALTEVLAENAGSPAWPDRSFVPDALRD
jgi:hypothetical protein